MLILVTAISWSVVVGILGALGGTITGFCLNELSYVLKSRREDQRTIGRALAELLEVMHFAEVVPETMKTFKNMLPASISPEHEIALRNAIEILLPSSDSLQKRYDDAVSSVSGAFPLLAYRLRSKDVIRPIIKTMRQAMSADSNAAKLWLNLEDKLVKATLPALKALILELAKRHGRATFKDVSSRLAKPNEISQEHTDILAPIFAQIQQAVAQSSIHNKTEK